MNRVVQSTVVTSLNKQDYFSLLKFLCTTSDSRDRNDNTTYWTDDIFYPKYFEDKLSAKHVECFQDADQGNTSSSSNQGSGSKKKHRERIPHTRERRDMFWRGVTTVNKVEAHVGLATFAMVVRSLEAKPLFTPPCSPPRQGYLLADDYNVHIVASTASFGKKAVPRVKARRRLREACRRIFPYHAKRHKEYTITAHPMVLFAKWEDILADVYEALKKTNCYVVES